MAFTEGKTKRGCCLFWGWIDAIDAIEDIEDIEAMEGDSSAWGCGWDRKRSPSVVEGDLFFGGDSSWGELCGRDGYLMNLVVAVPEAVRAVTT